MQQTASSLVHDKGLRTRADGLLLRVLRQSPGWTLALLLGTVGSAAATLVLPTALGNAVDAMFAGNGSAWPLQILAIVIAADVAFEMLTQLALPLCKAEGTRWLRKGLLRHVFGLGLGGQERFAAGDLVSRLVANSEETAGGIPTVLRAISSLLLSIGGVVALGLISPWLAVTFVVGVPFGILLVKVFVSETSPLIARYMEIYGTVSARLVDAMSGVRTIRASGTVNREVSRVRLPGLKLSESGYAMWLAQGKVSWQASLLAPALEIAVLIVAGYEVAHGRISAGEMLAAVSYVTIGLGFLQQASIMMALAQARAGARRLTEVFQRPVMRAGSSPLPPGPGELVIDGVSVRASESLVLDDITLKVPAGQAVALVGNSAAGKSTLARVAGRLIDPAEGRVALDGVQLADVRPADLRRAVTFAFERPALIGGTIEDAVVFGCEPHSRDSLEDAAQMASADSFIRRLPEGYDTRLEEAPLSGGEAQRLGLARCIVRRGRLLILDDATSSLDTVTEARVSEALTQRLAGRTRLIIAHRVATAARCDLVAWLEQGRIRRLAPHHVLWEDPEYRAIFRPHDPDAQAPELAESEREATCPAQG